MIDVTVVVRPDGEADADDAGSDVKTGRAEVETPADTDPLAETDETGVTGRTLTLTLTDEVCDKPDAGGVADPAPDPVLEALEAPAPEPEADVVYDMVPE